ncbi:MAG: ASKHA domain-containing protein [Cloacibacillus sp.]
MNVELCGEKDLHALACRAGVDISHPCGGKGICGKCRMAVGGTSQPYTETEMRILTADERKNNIRLACQIKPEAGMTVALVDRADESMQILHGLGCGTEMVVEAAFSHANLGVALDIGTTTLVAYLIDTVRAAVLAVTSAVNPQTMYGDDVISRISYIVDNPEGLVVLNKKLIHTVNDMIRNLLEKNGAQPVNLSQIIVSGNTTMEHIFAAVDPQSIGRAPFRPPFISLNEIKASSVGLNVVPNAKVSFIPNISGFVGGDITSGIFYSGMVESEKLSLLIDIGTNNEMALGNSSYLLCCSAAAGPALEGAKISQGMRASSGAIDTVAIINEEVDCTIIGNRPPKGICGSGLVDAIALMINEKIIETNGKFASLSQGSLYHRMDRRNKRFLLTNTTDPIYITQKDIREIQLAKSAIATGIEIMLQEAGKDLKEVEKIYMAGAFGNYINIHNAQTVGMLPMISDKKIHPIGNSSGLGAMKLLCYPQGLKRCCEISEMATHIELATHKSFQELFVKNMLF